MSGDSKFNEQADYFGRMPEAAVLTEGGADVVMDPSREFLLESLEVQDRALEELRAQIADLKVYNADLDDEVIHLQRCWDKCAESLRNAKAKNHRLMLRANQLSQGGV